MKLVKAKLNKRWDLILPEHRAARSEWHELDGWEGPRLLSMSKNIGEGDVVYYVGAELGEMSALCELWGAKTVLFEPNFSAWPSIKQTYEANGFKPLRCYPGFASNVHQPIPLKPDTALLDGKGWQIQPDGYPYSANGEIIEAHGFSELFLEADGLPQYKIDTLVAEGAVPPTVITFDCEGSDWEVLKGAEKTLETYHPKIWASIHPEFMFDQYKEYSRNFRDWIIDKGYTEHILDYQHELHCYYEPNGKPAK